MKPVIIVFLGFFVLSCSTHSESTEKATELVLTELTPNAIVFINEANEFPKKIKYWLESGKIKAVISNDSLEIPFEFEKIKE